MMTRYNTLLLKLACLFCCIFEGEGLCALPCTRANRTYDSVPPGSGWIFTYDLTTATRLDGTFVTCWERSRQFFVQREEIDGEQYYQCIYDPLLDKTQTVRVMYLSGWVHSTINPTICDICNGTFIEQHFVGIARDAEGCRVAPICNIPAICPVTDPTTQIRCTGCEASEAADDGICCDGQNNQP